MKRIWIKKLVVVFSLMVCMCTVAACSSADWEAICLDDSAISANSNNSLAVGSSETNISGKFSLTINSFSGVKKIATLELLENEAINFEFTLSSGKAKVVLVKDGVVHVLTEKDHKGEMPLTLAKGSYALKIVGVDAKIVFKTNLSK